MSQWYLFKQNNSYGVWDGPKHVVVEATSEDEAWAIAIRDTEVYKDEGQDCGCCGSRWEWVDDHPTPRAPLSVIVNEWAEQLRDYSKSVAIYCLDGTVHRIGPQHD